MKQATAPFMEPARLTGARFGSVPKCYIRATLDKAVSLGQQDKMLQNWDIEHIITLESGHFPLISVEGKLLDTFDECVNLELS